MKQWLIIIIVILGALLFAAVQQYCYINEKYETSMANIKAYDMELSAEKNKSVAYKLTVDQLEYFKDSVLQELDSTRKVLKIKDKNLIALQQIKSGFSKTDTIRIPQVDTLFKEPSLSMDTLLGDEWYSLKLGLKYPSTIAVSTEFKSKKNIIVSTKKETVNPPKKFFLFRWFQKKHKVLTVDVIEENPYIEDESSRYVEIIK